MKKNLLCAVAIIFILTLCSCDLKREEPLDLNDTSTWFSVSSDEKATGDIAREIKNGMSFKEIVSLLGKPQRDVGKDVWIMQWDLSDGSKLNVCFGMADPNVMAASRSKGDMIATECILSAGK